MQSPTSLADANVTSMILELPIACLTEGKGPVIGGWTTASVPANRTLSATPASGLDGTTQAGRLRAGVAPGRAARQ